MSRLILLLLLAQPMSIVAQVRDGSSVDNTLNALRDRQKSVTHASGRVQIYSYDNRRQTQRYGFVGTFWKVGREWITSGTSTIRGHHLIGYGRSYPADSTPMDRRLESLLITNGRQGMYRVSVPNSPSEVSLNVYGIEGRGFSADFFLNLHARIRPTTSTESIVPATTFTLAYNGGTIVVDSTQGYAIVGGETDTGGHPHAVTDKWEIDYQVVDGILFPRRYYVRSLTPDGREDSFVEVIFSDVTLSKEAVEGVFPFVLPVGVAVTDRVRDLSFVTGSGVLIDHLRSGLVYDEAFATSAPAGGIVSPEQSHANPTNQFGAVYVAGLAVAFLITAFGVFAYLRQSI